MCIKAIQKHSITWKTKTDTNCYWTIEWSRPLFMHWTQRCLFNFIDYSPDQCVLGNALRMRKCNITCASVRVYVCRYMLYVCIMNACMYRVCIYTANSYCTRARSLIGQHLSPPPATLLAHRDTKTKHTLARDTRPVRETYLTMHAIIERDGK